MAANVALKNHPFLPVTTGNFHDCECDSTRILNDTLKRTGSHYQHSIALNAAQFLHGLQQDIHGLEWYRSSNHKHVKCCVI